MGFSLRRRTKGKDSWINYSASSKGPHGSYSQKLGENTTLNIGPNGTRLTYNFGGGLRWTSSVGGKKKSMTGVPAGRDEFSIKDAITPHDRELAERTDNLAGECNEVQEKHTEAIESLYLAQSTGNTIGASAKAAMSEYCASLCNTYNKRYELLRTYDRDLVNYPRNFAAERVTAPERFSELRDCIIAFDAHIEVLSEQKWMEPSLVSETLKVREQMADELKRLVSTWTK